MKIRCAEGPPELGIRHLAWQGHSLCNKGFMKVFGIGKGRFRTLFRAAKAGKDACPFDNRYVVRGLQPMTPAAELIHGFLTKLYLEQAEHLPDGINSNKRPRHAGHRFDPPDMPREHIRHLPPGSFSEYFAQCRAIHPGTKMSKKLFSQARVPCVAWHRKLLARRYGCGTSRTNYVSDSVPTMQSVGNAFDIDLSSGSWDIAQRRFGHRGLSWTSIWLGSTVTARSTGLSALDPGCALPTLDPM